MPESRPSRSAKSTPERDTWPVTSTTVSETHSRFHDRRTVRRRVRGPEAVSRPPTPATKPGIVRVYTPRIGTDMPICRSSEPQVVMAQVAIPASMRPVTSAAMHSTTWRPCLRIAISVRTATGTPSMMSASSSATGTKSTRASTEPKFWTSAWTPSVVACA